MDTEIATTRQTKIIATLGPACVSAESIENLVRAGMNVARLNFSHGTHDSHLLAARRVRAAAAAANRPVAILQDIQGPKIRTGPFAEGAVELAVGDEVLLRAGEEPGTVATVFVSYSRLLEDVGVGDDVLLADGMMRLRVLGRRDDGLRAEIVVGGTLRSQQGVAFPGVQLTSPTVTDRDRRDLAFGQEIGVDLIAASFVQSAADIEEVREYSGGQTPVIAKIERAVAYENLDEILAAADGIMVARGDLGVEIPLQKIPKVQRDILARTNRAGLYSITATEMLQSMTDAFRPTRAEVTDVANSVFQGTDAVMLSGETAIGRHPARTVEVMDTICREAESGTSETTIRDATQPPEELAFASATANAAVEAARSLGVRIIVSFTETGGTAQLISKLRPQAQIHALTPNPRVYRQMALMWGVEPAIVERLDSTDEMLRTVDSQLQRQGAHCEGETVVIVAGVPPNRRASTNLMKLHRIGAEDL